MFFLASVTSHLCYTALRVGTPDQRNLEGRSGRNPHSSIAQKSSSKTSTRDAVQGATEQFLRIDQAIILGDPVKLEPIGEALRHNTIAILNGPFVKSIPQTKTTIRKHG